MQHRSPTGDRVVEIDLGLESGGTVADLVAALGSAEPELGLVVDGNWSHPSTPLTELRIREGSLVAASSRPDSAPPPSARMLIVTGGLRAGARYPLPPAAELSVGRAPGNDIVIDEPSVSRRHLGFLVEDPPAVIDLGSCNGVTVDRQPARGPTPVGEGSTVRMGATRLSWRVEPDDVPFAFKAALGMVRGTSPFNRPPRVSPPVEQAVIAVPAEPPDPPPAEPLSWAGIVLPIVGGAVVALLLSPLFAVFAALGPILTIGTWLERRRRAKRGARDGRRRLERELIDLRSSLPSLRAAELDRLAGLHPDLSEVARRATAPSVRCWERRRSDPDSMQLVVGTVDRPWTPPIDVVGDGSAAVSAIDLISDQDQLVDVASVVDLGPGRIVGLVGPAAVTRPLARSLLVQAAVHHGPADLAIVAIGDSGASVDEWMWARWFPHSSDVVAGRAGGLIATKPGEVAAVLESAAADASTRTRLVVIDGAEPLTGRAAPGRVLLADERVAALVLVSDGHFLPATCATVIEVVHPAGRLRVLDPRTTDATCGVVAWGVDEEVAAEVARGLARLDDPELAAPTADLPAAVGLEEMYGCEVDTAAVSRRWATSRGTADLRLPIGADAHGPIWLDLVADGPHVLVGGTTGSGKSELLRTMVAGLAMAADPDHVAVVLVDYKGGAAFDRCADLPHVAGMVTDLDDRLAERALRCLEAELRHREGRLRAEEAEDMATFRAATAGRLVDPLPRLVVVVDEFASLAADLPDFLHSLVGIAQRGRSLGVHLVLATQRPAGVVTEDIRANTGCRIALRVTDRQDSIDVIDASDAATIPRHRPGRAIARLGPGELIAFQSALVSGHSRRRSGVSVIDQARLGEQSVGVDQSDPTDLDRLVQAVRDADGLRGGSRPRPPWPPPLPTDVAANRLRRQAGDGAAVWLVDDPDAQTQVVDGWNPSDGHLVAIGGPGSGTSTTLAAVVLDLCRRRPADELHVQVIDLDGGSLAPLLELPHVGSVVGPTEAERRARLLRLLDEEIASRRGGVDAAAFEIVLVIDDLAGLSRAHDPVRDPEPHDRLSRIWSDGPAVGVRVAASVTRAADLGPDSAATSGVVLIHRVAEPGDGLRFGSRADTSAFAPGRAVRVDDGREVQVARPDEGLPAAVADVGRATAPPATPPMVVGSLATMIEWRRLPACARFERQTIELIFACDDAALQPCGLTLFRGEHATVLGPPRSGRTNTLGVIGRTLGDRAVVVGPPDSELADRLGVPVVDPADVEPLLESESSVLLVDDVDGLDDPAGAFATLLERRPGLRMIAATSADRLRARFGHWSTELRTCRSGVILRPGPLDGDLLGVALPPRLELPNIPGRGLVVADGVARIAQVAWLGD